MIYISDIQNFIVGVKHLINEAIRKAPYDKTYTGKITDTSGGKYNVKINTVVYENTPALVNGLAIGDYVYILFPQNNPIQRVILGKKR